MVLRGRNERLTVFGMYCGKRMGVETTNVMDLQEVGCGVWTGSIWLRIGTGGGHL